MFEQPTYSVNENAGPAQPVLVLSNPSSMTFSVTVTNTDGSATGEYCIYRIFKNLKVSWNPHISAGKRGVRSNMPIQYVTVSAKISLVCTKI